MSLSFLILCALCCHLVPVIDATATGAGRDKQWSFGPRLLRHDYAPIGPRGAAATARSIFTVYILDTRAQPGRARFDATRLLNEKLPPLLRQDQCTLLQSGIGEFNRAQLEFYCGDAPDTNDLERLDNTMRFLASEFGAANLMLERSSPYRTPRPVFWPGSGLDMVELMREGAPETRRRYGTVYRATDTTQTGATWGLDRIDQRAGLLNGDYVYENTAQAIDVYVVDTGIQTTHVEFQGRASFLYNAVDSINTDCAGHGTHVAGIVGSRTYGVAKNVSLFAVKVLGCNGTGTTFTILAGLNAVLGRVATSGRRSVINLSLGGEKSAILDAALLEIAQLNNTVVVVAAGNDAGDACDYSPSDLGQSAAVLVVSASDSTDSRPDWANNGACVDITAPGVGIASTWIGDSNVAVAMLSGTSMAAPFAAGVAALLLQQESDLTVPEVYGTITAEATPNIVARASSQGGGKNLLFSLIRLHASSPSPQTPPPTTRAPTSGGGGGGGGEDPADSFPQPSGSDATVVYSLALPLMLLAFFCL